MPEKLYRGVRAGLNTLTVATEARMVRFLYSFSSSKINKGGTRDHTSHLVRHIWDPRFHSSANGRIRVHQLYWSWSSMQQLTKFPRTPKMCVRGANMAQNAAASKLCTPSALKILLVVWVLLQIGPIPGWVLPDTRPYHKSGNGASHHRCTWLVSLMHSAMRWDTAWVATLDYRDHASYN